MGRKLVVVGAGSWGTALASIAAPQCPTVIWARSAVTADEIEIRHTNERYLPGLGLSTELVATANLVVALTGADAVLMAVPSHGTRAILEQAAAWIAPGTPVFSLSKGIEADTMMRMSEVITSVVPQATTGVLTGPNLAGEIAPGQPAACIDTAFGDVACLLFDRCHRLRDRWSDEERAGDRGGHRYRLRLR